MQQHFFGSRSELISLAAYQAETHTLYLTYHSGSVTIAYQGVKPELYDELTRSPYPDVCIRFKIQARHAFRRIEPAFEAVNYSFMK